MVVDWHFDASFGQSRGLSLFFFFFLAVLSLFLLHVGFLQLQQGEATFQFLVCRLLIAMATVCCCRAQAVEHRLSTCVAQAQLLRGTWYPPRPGIKPGSYALTGGLFTTGPAGKFYSVSFNWALCMLEHCQTKLGSSINNLKTRRDSPKLLWTC